MNARIASVGLGLLFVACMPAGLSRSGSDDGGIDILDAGLGSSEENDPGSTGGGGTEDAGIADGGGTADAGTAGDAGTTTGGGDVPGDGGFTLPEGGVSEYVGVAEDGVVCGATGDTCAVGSSCCVAFAVSSLTGTCTEGAEATCDSGTYPIGCDGKEDCTGEGEVCCLAGIEQALTNFNLSKLRGSCVAAAECVDVTTAGEEESRQQACVESAECPDDEVCCGVSGGILSLPIDVGVCASACEL